MEDGWGSQSDWKKEEVAGTVLSQMRMEKVRGDQTGLQKSW